MRDPSTDSSGQSLQPESTGEVESGTSNLDDSGPQDEEMNASESEIASEGESEPKSEAELSSTAPEPGTQPNLSIEPPEPEVEPVPPVRRSGRTRQPRTMYGDPLIYSILAALQASLSSSPAANVLAHDTLKDSPLD